MTEGAQRPEVPPFEDLPGTGSFAGYSEYILLMEQCWHQDAAARPTFAQVSVKHNKAFCKPKTLSSYGINPLECQHQ